MSSADKICPSASRDDILGKYLGNATALLRVLAATCLLDKHSIIGLFVSDILLSILSPSNRRRDCLFQPQDARAF